MIITPVVISEKCSARIYTSSVTRGWTKNHDSKILLYSSRILKASKISRCIITVLYKKVKPRAKAHQVQSVFVLKFGTLNLIVLYDYMTPETLFTCDYDEQRWVYSPTIIKNFHISPTTRADFLWKILLQIPFGILPNITDHITNSNIYWWIA